MATAIDKSASTADLLKYAFFGLIALCIPFVLWADEGFLINPADPHWNHIAGVRWLLLIHGLGGVTALMAGGLQMSSRIRRNRPEVHRLLGKIYLGGVTVAAPVAIMMGTSTLEPVTIRFEQWFQGGIWLLSAWVAYACIRNRQMASHKAWMIRSYAFTLVFVLARVPDVFLRSYSDQFLGDLLWSLVVVATISPELISTTQALWRTNGAKVRDGA